MPQSLVKLLVHIVFSTKNRRNLISHEMEHPLFSYIHGIVENNSSKLLVGNGTSDHVHLLISVGKTMNVSHLIGDIKRDSSKWIKQNGGPADFFWQEGYGAFSVSQSNVAAVIDYIRGQKEHHADHDFQAEFRSFLEKYEVEYDERYVWD